MKETFLQAVTLLWTLAEKNDVVLKRSEEESLLTILLPFLNTQIYDLETSIVAIQCILTLSEENDSMLEQIKASEEQVLRLFDLETRDNLNEAEVLMLRTLAAGLVINMYNGFTTNQGVHLVGKCVTMLSKTLSIDCEEKIKIFAAHLEREDNDLNQKNQKKLQQLKIMVNSQIQAIEIFANLCSEQEGSIDDTVSDNSNFDEDMDEHNMSENGSMNQDYDLTNSHLCIEAIEVIVAEELQLKVWNKTHMLPKDVEEILKLSNDGDYLCKRFYTLRCRAFLCLTNLILNLNSSTLGGVDHLFRFVFFN